MTAPADQTEAQSGRALLVRIVRTYLAPRWKTLASRSRGSLVSKTIR